MERLEVRRIGQENTTRFLMSDIKSDKQGRRDGKEVGRSYEKRNLERTQ